MKSTVIGAAFLSGCLLFPHAVSADVAARYQEMDKNPVIDLEMTIEADDAGNIRIQSSKVNQYQLVRDGTLYLIAVGPTETTVMKASDFLQVQREAMAEIGWKEPSEVPEEIKFQFLPMKEETVGGRIGTSFGIVTKERPKPLYGSIVIGKDATLAPIGRAIASANSTAIKGMGSMGAMLQGMNADMTSLMERGAPLRMLSVELTDVSYDRIPVQRFELPTKPLTIEEIRKAVVPPKLPSPPTLPPAKKQGD